MPSVQVNLPAILTSPEPALELACEALTVADALRSAVAQAPRYGSRIFLADRLLVSVVLNGRHLAPTTAATTPLAAGDRIEVCAARRRRLTSFSRGAPRAATRDPSPGVSAGPRGYAPPEARNHGRRESCDEPMDPPRGAQRASLRSVARHDGSHLPGSVVVQLATRGTTRPTAGPLSWATTPTPARTRRTGRSSPTS